MDSFHSRVFKVEGSAPSPLLKKSILRCALKLGDYADYYSAGMATTDKASVQAELRGHLTDLYQAKQRQGCSHDQALGELLQLYDNWAKSAYSPSIAASAALWDAIQHTMNQQPSREDMGRTRRQPLQNRALLPGGGFLDVHITQVSYPSRADEMNARLDKIMSFCLTRASSSPASTHGQQNLYGQKGPWVRQDIRFQGDLTSLVEMLQVGVVPVSICSKAAAVLKEVAARGDPEVQEAIGREGGVTALFNLLDYEDTCELWHNALRALRVLMGRRSNKEAAARVGAVAKLVALLQTSSADVGLQTQVGQVLYMLMDPQVPVHLSALRECGGIPTLICMLGSYTKATQVRALWVLHAACEHSRGNRRLVLEYHGVPALQRLARCSDDDTITATAAAVINLVCGKVSVPHQYMQAAGAWMI